jgi:hypothetical protein
MIPVKGRGPYAIAMDTVSAQRLLIAVCASLPLERDSAATAVARFENLMSRPPRLANGDLAAKDPDTLMPLDKLSKSHSLGRALQTLIEAGGRDELFSFKDRTTGLQRSCLTETQDRGFLRVQFRMPIPQVRIDHRIGQRVQKRWVYGPEFEDYNAECRKLGLGDRIRHFVISEATFEKVGRTLSS